MNLNALSQLF